MLTAIVVDDEPGAREDLAALLRDEQVEVLALCDGAASALAALKDQSPDVLFLDIDMPGVSGFELLGMIDDERLPRVVFVTAHEGYAIKAFEQNAADYVLKPASRERLRKTLDRLRAAPAGTARPVWAEAPLKRLPCLGPRHIKLVDLSDVEFVKSTLSGVYVVSAAGEFSTDLTLKVLEDRTPLVRCHKQYLVNIDRVDEIRLDDNLLGTLKTKSGKEVPVSRRHLADLRKQLGL